MKHYPSIKEILKLLTAGTIISAFILSPNTTRATRRYISSILDEKWREFDRYKLKKTLILLKRKGLVEIKETKRGPIVSITQKGKKISLQYNIDSMIIRRPTIWDKLWQVIIFDVPEEKKNNRDIFRKKLIELGFIQIQKSVFVHPYPCDQEIAFLREIYDIGDNVLYIKATNIEGDEKLIQLFHLS